MAGFPGAKPQKTRLFSRGTLCEDAGRVWTWKVRGFSLGHQKEVSWYRRGVWRT